MNYNENGYKIPTVYVALTYDCLYDDYDTVNVHELQKQVSHLTKRFTLLG